jgi:glutathione S-transferase
MKLYYYPLSTYCQKVLIALYEKGIEFEGESLMLFDPEVRDQFREIYPLGKIPLLVDDNDHMVPESSIIIEYLDTKAKPLLIFGDADEQRQIRFKDRMFDLYLLETIATLFFQNMKPANEQDPERIATAQFQIDKIYMFMEMELENQPFSCGSEFTMADCTAAAGLFYASKVAPFDDRPLIKQYWERLCSMPSVQRVHAEAAPHLAELEKRDAA